jgi:hypothetical protein
MLEAVVGSKGAERVLLFQQPGGKAMPLKLRRHST